MDVYEWRMRCSGQYCRSIFRPSEREQAPVAPLAPRPFTPSLAVPVPPVSPLSQLPLVPLLNTDVPSFAPRRLYVVPPRNPGKQPESIPVSSPISLPSPILLERLPTQREKGMIAPPEQHAGRAGREGEGRRTGFNPLCTVSNRRFKRRERVLRKRCRGLFIPVKRRISSTASR